MQIDFYGQAAFPPQILWLTGLPASGKTTIAHNLRSRLTALKIRAIVFDGDDLRAGVNRGLGFSFDDRGEAIRRASAMALAAAEAGSFAIVAMVSPFRQQRDEARAFFEDYTFREIWVNTPIEVCIGRDPKGLYSRAISGDLEDLTGLGQEYQPPLNADLVVNGSEPLEIVLNQIMALIADGL